MEGEWAARSRGETVFVGVPFGIKALDAKLGGYPRALLTVLGMAEGGGKSSFVINAAMAMATLGMRARIDSLEDPEDMWADRGFAHLTGINSEDIQFGRLDAAQKDRLRRAAPRMPEWILDARTGRTVKQILRDAWATRGDWDALFVDYLQAIAPGKGEQNNDEMRIKNAVRILAAFAGRVKKPVIALSQFKKEQQERGHRVLEKTRLTKDGPSYAGYIPVMTDLYGSAVIAQVAKLAMLSHRPGQWDKTLQDDTIELYIPKRNRGRGGKETLKWDPTTSRIW